MNSVTNCINGPELARLLNKAMGERASDRAALDTYSSDLRSDSENIERLAQETGSSFEWLRHLQTALLGECAVLVANGWTQRGECDGVWIWERSEKDPTLLVGLKKAEAAEILSHRRIIPSERTADLRLRALRDAASVRIPLLTALVADEKWAESYNSRREEDKLSRSVFPYHKN